MDILAILEDGILYRTIDGVDVAYSKHGAFEDLFREAADEIKFLRKTAGAVTQGPSFNDIAKDLPRNDPKHGSPKTTGL